MNEFDFFTLWWLNADSVAIEPNGPGLPFGPQQLTGKPAIGNGLFCWFSDCIFRDRRLLVDIFRCVQLQKAHKSTV